MRTTFLQDRPPRYLTHKSRRHLPATALTTSANKWKPSARLMNPCKRWSRRPTKKNLVRKILRKLLIVRTLTSSIMPKACVTIATTSKEDQKWPTIVSTPTRACMLVVFAEIATIISEFIVKSFSMLLKCTQIEILLESLEMTAL